MPSLERKSGTDGLGKVKIRGFGEMLSMPGFNAELSFSRQYQMLEPSGIGALVYGGAQSHQNPSSVQAARIILDGPGGNDGGNGGGCMPSCGPCVRVGMLGFRQCIDSNCNSFFQKC